MVLTFVTDGLEYSCCPDINREPEGLTTFAHGECPVRGIGSVMGAELRPKSFWGERKEKHKKTLLKVHLPNSFTKQKGDET